MSSDFLAPWSLRAKFDELPVPFRGHDQQAAPPMKNERTASAKKFEEIDLNFAGTADDALSASLVDEMLRAGLTRRG